MSEPDSMPIAELRATLSRQYHAGLEMLHACIERCPDELWSDDTPTNPYWQVAYHVLFYTDFYLHEHHERFTPWELHETGIEDLGTRFAETGEPFQPYTRDQVLTYWLHVAGFVDDAVGSMDLTAPESGFPWYRMSKLEHQLVNVRHLQHHGGQLADRLRIVAGLGSPWKGSGRGRSAG